MAVKQVGVYVPCYNSQNTLALCIQGIMAQTYPLEEVYVVDDGSTDESAAIARRLGLKIISHEENKGLSAVRNTARIHMNSEFIASLDADCVPEPDWLEKIIAHFDNGRVAGVGGKLLESYTLTVFDAWRSVHMKQYWDDHTTPAFLFGSNCVFRRAALESVGGYHEGLRNNYEDVDICERLKEQGFVLEYEQEAKARHLRQDSLETVLNTFWQWHLAYYQRKDWYTSREKFLAKVKDNIWFANRYIEEDLKANHFNLIYLNFLLGIHHTMRDFEFFMLRRANYEKRQPLSYWLALIDISLCAHLFYEKKMVTSVLNESCCIPENFLYVSYILYKAIAKKFGNDKIFLLTLYNHLFLSLFHMSDVLLSQCLKGSVSVESVWDSLINKSHPYLDTQFLQEIALVFEEWFSYINTAYPQFHAIVTESAQRTQEEVASIFAPCTAAQ